jgi:hypothetical protein
MANNSIVAVGNKSLPVPLVLDPSLNVLGNKALVIPPKRNLFMPVKYDMVIFELRFPESQNALASSTFFNSIPVPSDYIDGSSRPMNQSPMNNAITNICPLKGKSILFLAGGVETIRKDGGTSAFTKNGVLDNDHFHALISSDSPVRLRGDGLFFHDWRRKRKIMILCKFQLP